MAVRWASAARRTEGMTKRARPNGLARLCSGRQEVAAAFALPDDEPEPDEPEPLPALDEPAPDEPEPDEPEPELDEPELDEPEPEPEEDDADVVVDAGVGDESDFVGVSAPGEAGFSALTLPARESFR